MVAVQDAVCIEDLAVDDSVEFVGRPYVKHVGSLVDVVGPGGVRLVDEEGVCDF